MMPIKPTMGLRAFYPIRRFLSHQKSSKYLRVLGIETSCDDTGIAIVDSDHNILGQARYSQSSIHAIHGGIVLEFAQTLHKQNINKATTEVLEKSKLSIKDLDAIAVTVKPGIFNCLEVGTEYAKDLCSLYNKPLIPIHHMEAHALTARLTENVEFPFLVLLISGGHCILALAESVSKFSVLGETTCSTPGVLFDKISRKIKLGNLRQYIFMQGGPAIENASKKGNPLAIDLFPQMTKQRSCNFTFSGFYTKAMLYIEEEEKKLGIKGNTLLPNVYDFCASFQYSLTRYLCQKVEIAINKLKIKNIKVNTLVISGGVASNGFIRKILKHVCDEYNYKFVAPSEELCSDNGVMIAWNGIERLKEDLPVFKPPDLHLIQPSPKCPLGEVMQDLQDIVWKGKYVKLKDLLQGTNSCEGCSTNENKNTTNEKLQSKIDI